MVTNIDLAGGILRIRDPVNDGYVYEHHKIASKNKEMEESKEPPIETDLQLASLYLGSYSHTNGTKIHKHERLSYFKDAASITPSLINRESHQFKRLH